MVSSLNLHRVHHINAQVQTGTFSLVDVPNPDVEMSQRKHYMELVQLACIMASIIGRGHNGKFLRSKSLVTRARAEVIAARKRSSQRAFLRLLKQGIPHTDLQVHEIVERQSQANSLSKQDICRKPEFHPVFLEEAYERCRNICAEYAKTFYLGTRLMTEERQKATWAIYGKRLKPRIDKLVLQRQYYQITYSSKKLLEKIFSSEDLRSNSVDPHSHTRDELSKEMYADR
ncbi:hypothetical protein D5086_000086 [Populus alba]|uniref:Uncharacterized protein n=1 Tax=Populus alba TaxID=43335 RepID=A0ACC4CX13_POPAL